MPSITTVLFDLDGTLLDTAPTFAHIINDMKGLNDGTRIHADELRFVVSLGAKKMLQYAFPELDEKRISENLYEKFLEEYADKIDYLTKPLPGIPDTLSRLIEDGLKWGIVSNKAERFTKTLTEFFDWHDKASVIIGGDTTPEKKPSPVPLMHALQLIDVTPEECLFVGDAEVDILAGKRAGMKTMVANFGYISPKFDYQAWGADAIADHPAQIIDFIQIHNDQR